MSGSRPFKNRSDAGRALAQPLLARPLTDPVVLAMPRGGVPVAVEVARTLRAPLDLVLVRKIGVPYQRELAAAAIVDGDHPELVRNEDVISLAGISTRYIEEEAKKQLAEIERRQRVYFQGRTRAPLEGRELILIDDGIATGASVRAALIALRRKKPKTLILAVPVAPISTLEALRGEVDEIICLQTPEPFHAIGLHYRDFHEVADEEVVDLLAEAAAALDGPQPGTA